MLSSTLALVWVVAPALAVAVAVLWIFVLIAVYAWVIKPLTEWLTKPQGGFFKRVALWPVKKASSAVERLMREQIAAAKRYIAANAGPLILIFDQYADVTNRIAGTLGDMSEQIYEALWTLNHETVPRKIAAALIPIRNVLANHTDRLDTLEDLNRRVAVELGDTLRALPWGVPGGYVTNFEAFLGRFVQLWEHYWNVTRDQLNTLLQDTIPQIRRDVADLARRLDVQIDARFDALAGRIVDLERQAQNVILPRLEALQEAVDLLSDQVFGPVAGGLTALLERIGEIERRLEEDVAQRFEQLEAGLADLRLDLEEGIQTGLEAFRSRIADLERTVNEILPAQLAAMQLAIDTLAQEVFTGIGVGLTTLTARIVALEQEIQTRIIPGFDAILGRIEALEAQLRDDILPRMRALEDLLAPAAFAALVLATLQTSAPYLFCRNVVTGAKEVCAAPSDYIDDLLLATFFLITGLSIIELARELQAITGFTAAAIDDFIIED